MISIQNLSKSFNGHTYAVSDFNLQLKAGEICCLIGTSGCGKTTTLKMINQLIEPSSGDIIIDDTSYKDCSKIEWRRGIGYVIQKAGLLPHLNIKNNIEILAKVLKVSKEKRDERVKFLMKMINLDYDQYAYKYPHELSGGQQQRVGIARALMQDPPLMLMDEPFGALDPITRNSLHNEFLDLNKKLSKTIILVTHDIQEAFKLADKIIVMHEGKIIQQGSQQQLEQQPINSFVKDFIGGIYH